MIKMPTRAEEEKDSLIITEVNLDFHSAVRLNQSCVFIFIADVYFAYVSKQKYQIGLQKGQIIKKHCSGDWWKSTVLPTRQRGMFPDNFVRVLQKVENKTAILREHPCEVQRRCKAIYNYTKVNEDELTLAIGDVIDILAEVEEGWWKGKLNNKIGVFPSNFVVLILNPPVLKGNPLTNSYADEKGTDIKSKKSPSSSQQRNQKNFEENAFVHNRVVDISGDVFKSPILSISPFRELCRVEFPYSPQNDDEIELKIGEVITVIDKDLPDKGWWKGEIKGKVGVFPDNFVKLLPPDDESDDALLKEFTTNRTHLSIPSSTSSKTPKSAVSLEEFQHEIGVENTSAVPLRMVCSNRKIELESQLTSSDRSNEYIYIKQKGTETEGCDDKKLPPTHFIKKPIIPCQKSVSCAGGKSVSNVRQKEKNVEQKPELSQNNSINKRNETPSNTEKASNLDVIIHSNSEFDKVQRTSILFDMRARRVKAPKRRPPSLATNLITNTKTKNFSLFNETKKVYHEESEILSCAKSKELKSRDFRKEKVPWIDELKSNQIKLISVPNIEPRKTLVDINNKIRAQEKKTTTPVKTNLSTEIIQTNVDLPLSKEIYLPASSFSFHQSSLTETNIESEIGKSKANDAFDIRKTPTNQFHDFNYKLIKTRETKSTLNNDMQNIEMPKSSIEYQEKLTELEKRIQVLEENMQMQQKLIIDLQRMLQFQSNNVGLPKNN